MSTQSWRSLSLSGASLDHNLIVNNINTLVLPFLKGKGCKMFGSDLRIHIPENSLYTYPDLSIICGTPVTTGDEKDNFIKYMNESLSSLKGEAEVLKHLFISLYANPVINKLGNK